MINVSFYSKSKICDDELRFAVIAARYQDKWVFCRHRERSSWEIPGGHREPGEAIDQTAERELYEETGALDVELHCVAVYSVENDGIPSYGMLYYADIKKLGELPEGSEIAEVKLFELMPEPLTYPEIQPALYHRVQGWLNTQSGAGELWDVYDRNRNKTGRLHRRGDNLPEGDYHIVVHVWMKNSRGEYLLTKRSPNKGYPNMWETTGGSALAGDDSLSAALREVHEETGLTLDPSRGRRIFELITRDTFVDVWLFFQDFSLDDIVLQEGETCGARYVDSDELRALSERGELVPYRYLDRLLDDISM